MIKIITVVILLLVVTSCTGQLLDISKCENMLNMEPAVVEAIRQCVGVQK